MLSDALIRSIKPFRSPRRVSAGGGLHLLVAPSGGRYWRYSYRFHGKQKTMALGIHPDASLTEARARHQAAPEALAEGTDPGAQKPSENRTFEGVAREWHAHWSSGRHERHAYYVLRRLEGDVFPEIGSYPLGELATSCCLAPALANLIAPPVVL